MLRHPDSLFETPALAEDEEPAWRRDVRRDGLPEYHVFEDTGCSWHPRCLSCPYPHCRYDKNSSGYAIGKGTRHAERVLGLVNEGLSRQAIAERLRCSRRTVHRILAEARREGRL